MKQRIITFCMHSIFILVLLFMVAMFVSSFFVTSHVFASSVSNETVALEKVPFLLSVLHFLLFTAFFTLLIFLTRKIPEKILFATLFIVWFAVSIFFLAATNLSQLYDYQYILEIGQLFARGNYGAMSSDYINAYPYQLGICLFIEFLSRIFPSLPMGLFLQCLNAIACLTISRVLCFLCFYTGGSRNSHIFSVLCFLSLPMLLYCVYVYGTLYMMALVASSFLFFVCYIKKENHLFLLLSGVLLSLSYCFKPNMLVPLIAFVISCLFFSLLKKNLRPLLIALLAVILTFCLSVFIPLQYEYRSRIHLHPTVSTKARLIMGLQDNGPAFGWHNRYIEKYFPENLTDAERSEMANQDLSSQITYLKSDPLRTLNGLCEKIISQWLDPSYGTLRYITINKANGPIPILRDVLTDGCTTSSILLQFMKSYQQFIYLFAAVGLYSSLKEKKSISAFYIALTIFGGVLYHFIFEAKSCYAFVYMIYASVFASKGFLLFSNKPFASFFKQ